MKIVINKCFGGFSLSPKATKRLAELQGRKCFFYKGGISSPYERDTDPEMSLFSSAFATDDLEFLNSKLNSKDWFNMTQEEKELLNKLYDELYITNRPEDRTDKLLIQVVEELGEEANGACAELKIIEIPDGVDYYIHEYDGVESVHENHRSWG